MATSFVRIPRGIQMKALICISDARINRTDGIDLIILVKPLVRLGDDKESLHIRIHTNSYFDNIPNLFISY